MLNLRHTTLEDIDAILRIKAEPRVACFQYRYDLPGYADLLHRVLSGDNKVDPFTTNYSTIEQDRFVVGYVQHNHYTVDDVKMVYCSWNLTSTHWGQGIMRYALTELLNEWLGDAEIQHVFAEHFRANERCRRLLNRLGFGIQEIPFYDRITSAWQQKCLKWIVRRRLDAVAWNSPNQSPS